jgi:glycosyltransferase involved in cell wall biosynthesis
LREARLKKEMRSIGQQRCEPSLDEPEPRLAILGPPAVTRRMFELWRANQRLQARFDLRNPLHRRDYLLWLGEEGRSVGLDDASIAAAVAIMRRGTSLVCAPPRWPSQAKRAIVLPNETVDAWLAEPIAWDFGAQPRGIPMPRVLALLWELRQDVRLHFPNRTSADVRNFLAWCLTQGVRDRCVPVDLTEPGLAAFLDTPDPELGGHAAADHLPVTRLLRIVAALYDGPYPEIARQFPHTRQACFCIGIWVCGVLRRRFGWPESFVQRPLRWLSSTAPAVSDAFVTLNNLLLGLWEIYPDLQARYDLGTHEGRSALLEWFLAEGVREVELEDICAVAPVQALTHPASKAGSPTPGSQSGGRRVRVPPIPGVRFAPLAGEPAIKRELGLIGYADLVSGRAEDMRMSALALQRQRRGWAMLDRLSGAITTERGEAAAAFAEPPVINLVHLNADTAFFDYLFLRERGIEKAYTIGYWAWELGKFPEEWTSSFAFVDEVWAASRFAYEAIAPATTKPVFLMPMAVALPAAEAGLRRVDFGLPEDKFVFYFSFDFRSYASRKNPLAAVEAFRRAFPRRDAPAVLLLKTIGSEWKPEERDNLLEAIRGDPRILLIDRELTRARAIALLALSDCFLSLHRSEGFGRGPAEAMLLGKPVITTDYSGTADFATPETALLVDYELVLVGEDEYPGASGQVWAEPDIEQAAAAMRRISADPVLASRLGRAGRELIRRRYAPRLVGMRYIERIRAIVQGLKSDSERIPVFTTSHRHPCESGGPGPFARSRICGFTLSRE